MAAKKATRNKGGRPRKGKRDPKTGRVRSVDQDYVGVLVRLPEETRNRVKAAAKRAGLSMSEYMLQNEKRGQSIERADRLRSAVLAEVRRKVDEWFQPHIEEQENRLCDFLSPVVKDTTLSDEERDRRMDQLAQQFARARRALLGVYQNALAVETERALERLATGVIKRPEDVRIATDPPDLDDLLAVGA